MSARNTVKKYDTCLLDQKYWSTGTSLRPGKDLIHLLTLMEKLSLCNYPQDARYSDQRWLSQLSNRTLDFHPKRIAGLGRNVIPRKTAIQKKTEEIDLLFADDNEDAGIGSFTTVVTKQDANHHLMGRGIFEIVDRSSVPNGTRIFGTRFLGSMQKVDGKTFEKSRLVAQNYRDKDATTISTKSPTISRLGFRMAILCAMFPDMKPYLRDISQGYTQAESNLDRKVYLKLVAEMKLSKEKLLLAVKPLYGIVYTGSFRTLDTTRIIWESRRSSKGEFEGLTVLQVGDSFGFGSGSFLRDEATAGVKYLSKRREILQVGSSYDFNDLIINRIEENSYVLNQDEKLKVSRFLRRKRNS